MATVTLKVDERTREIWIADAASEGCSLSEWIRRACVVRLEGPPEPAPVALPRTLKPHRADSKSKAAEEHGKRERVAKTGMCEHRIPKGSFCKACG